jgi:hypothetical protein
MGRFRFSFIFWYDLGFFFGFIFGDSRSFFSLFSIVFFGVIFG